MRLVNDAERHEFRVEIGPVDVPAGGAEAIGSATKGPRDPHAAHGPVVLPPVGTVRIPQGVYLTGFSYELVDAAGRAVPAEVLHHLNLITPDYRELFLPISQRMLAVGRETGSHAMPGFLMGYPVPEGTAVVVTAMLHNPTPAAYSGVRVIVRLHYVPAGRPWPIINVYPFQLDVAFPVGDKSFDLPPGRSTWSYEARPAMEGRIMVIGGHVHDYAVRIALEDVTANEVMWEAQPVVDSLGRVLAVPVGRLYRTLGAKITPDHVYRVTVTYDNPTGDTLVAGGMGVVAGVVMQTRSGRWPRAAKTNDIYLMDRLHYLRVAAGDREALRAALARFKAGEELTPMAVPGEGHAHEH